MSDVAKNSGGGSDTAPRIERPEARFAEATAPETLAAEAPAVAEPPASEAEFLQQQAEQAKAAFDQTFEEFKQSLRDSAKLKVWAQRHPWAVTGAAVAGGFLLATMVFSPPRAHAAPATSETGNGQPHAGPPEPPRHRFAWLLTPLWEMLQPMLGQLIGSMMGAVASAVGAKATGLGGGTDREPSDGEPSDDGDPRDAGSSSAAEGPVPL